jgi:hypothetical protein
MSDLSEAFDRVIAKFIDAGHFTAEQIASEEGKELLHSLKWDQRNRLASAVPGLMAPADYNYPERSVLRDLQKSFNDVAGLSDVKPLLEEAANETLAAIAARGASPSLAEVPGAEKWVGDGMHKAANYALETIFGQKLLWSQCFGFDKAPDFNHNVYSALQMRFINLVPGFDVRAEQLDYDKKVVRNIHEVNNQPGLNDVRRILDAAVEETLKDIGLKPAGRISVPKPLQVKVKSGA